MFVQTLNAQELRQGDILSGLYYPEPDAGELKIDGLAKEPLEQQLLTTPIIQTDTKNNFRWMSGRIRYLLRGHVIVLSQCCDLEVRPGGLPKATAIVLAPVLDIPNSILKNQDHLAKLKTNVTTEFVNFYYLVECPPLSTGCVVNLNRVFSVSREGYSFLLARKVLEMTVVTRFQLKTKLQYNFSRPAGDDDHLYSAALQEPTTPAEGPA